MNSPDPRDEALLRANELQRLLATMLDALCLPGHEITSDGWRQACLLSGRYCEPFLSGHPAPEPDPVAEFVASCKPLSDDALEVLTPEARWRLYTVCGPAPEPPTDDGRISLTAQAVYDAWIWPAKFPVAKASQPSRAALARALRAAGGQLRHGWSAQECIDRLDTIATELENYD